MTRYVVNTVDIFAYVVHLYSYWNDHVQDGPLFFAPRYLSITVCDRTWINIEGFHGGFPVKILVATASAQSAPFCSIRDIKLYSITHFLGIQMIASSYQYHISRWRISKLYFITANICSACFRTVSWSIQYLRSSCDSSRCIGFTKMGRFGHISLAKRYTKCLSFPSGVMLDAISVSHPNLPEKISHSYGNLDRAFSSLFLPACTTSSSSRAAFGTIMEK